jgi:hypothetical protein
VPLRGSYVYLALRSAVPGVAIEDFHTQYFGARVMSRLVISVRQHCCHCLTLWQSSAASDLEKPLEKPDWQKSFAELVAEITQLRAVVRQKDAELDATNAHCTIMKRALMDANTQVDNLTKKKGRGSTKVKSRWISLPELKDSIYAEEAERIEREKQNAEKEAQKEAHAVAQNIRITSNTLLKVFDAPLSSYKLKDDLIVLAGALAIPTLGTVALLSERIREHLKGHPKLANNQRFARLFQSGSRCANPSCTTQQQTAPSLQHPPFIAQPIATISAPHPSLDLDSELHAYGHPGPVPQPSTYSHTSSLSFNQATYYTLASYAGPSTGC